MTVESPFSRWFSPKQTAKYLGVSEDALQAWRSARKPPRWSKTGKLVRYHVDDLDEFLKACRQEPLRKEAAA
jgi:excisionase family DNA binding protein